MFHYNKKIDTWSQTRIKNIRQIWGNTIPLQSNKTRFRSLPYLQIYLNSYLNKHGKKIINQLNKLSGQKNVINQFGFFLNSTPVSLHNAQDKFISISATHQFNKYPTVIIHELLHIIFYQQISLDKNLQKKLDTILSEKDINRLKEVITVLINVEFNDLIEVPDTGYTEHQEVRKKALKIWRKRKNFSDFIWQVALEMKKGE